MRLGLIGLGRIGAFHAETLHELGHDLVVTDVMPEAVDRNVTKDRAGPAADPAAVFATGGDGVVVAAATDAPPELILAGGAAGLAVFCEKPVARDAAEAVEVLRRSAGAGVQIGYNRRFDPAIE